MATATINTFTITKDVANARVNLIYTVNYDEFDIESNVGYHETYKLRGDDTFQDGDDNGVGDDPVGVTFFFVNPQRANGQSSVQRNQNWTLPWADLNEDSALGSALLNDDEIRAVVTLEPELPVTTVRESIARVVTAP
jgi:hypothetical protein